MKKRNKLIVLLLVIFLIIFVQIILIGYINEKDSILSEPTDKNRPGVYTPTTSIRMEPKEEDIITRIKYIIEGIKEQRERAKDPEWIKKQYKICDVECYVPEPIKGKESIAYFKSLNLKDDYVYIIIQFDPLFSGFYPWDLWTLRVEKVILLDGAGRESMYAKVPKSFLERKSYRFIRWMGVMSPQGKIRDSELREQVWNQTNEGRIEIDINFYEDLSDEQFEEVKQISNGRLIYYWSNHEFIPSEYDSINLEVDFDKIKDIASLNYVEKIEKVSHYNVFIESN